MDIERNLNQVINNNPQEGQLRGRPKNRMWNCVQKNKINANLKTGKGGKSHS
jgi:hypothetical protein